VGWNCDEKGPRRFGVLAGGLEAGIRRCFDFFDDEMLTSSGNQGQSIKFVIANPGASEPHSAASLTASIPPFLGASRRESCTCPWMFDDCARIFYTLRTDVFHLRTDLFHSSLFTSHCLLRKHMQCGLHIPYPVSRCLASTSCAGAQ
jgi:hypothetical protein